MDDDAPPAVAEWVVTYGDMMSLLLTFFIMLVSLSEVVADQKYRAILDALQQYLGYRTAPVSPEGVSFPLNSLLDSLTTLGSFSDKELGHGGVRTQGVDGIDYRVLRNREGIKRIVGTVGFSPGTAALSAEARQQIEAIRIEVAGKPNKIEILAHCSAPTGAMGSADRLDPYTLTYLRARAVGQTLEQRGIEPERMRIAAAAETIPALDASGKPAEEQDRVEVLIIDAWASEFVGPRPLFE
jgi:chemotaxis protein MotB